MSSGMLVKTSPYRKIRHPDFGDRYVQDGMLFFMDGSPMGLPETHRVTKPAPVLAPDAGRPVTQPPAAKARPAKAAASAAAAPPPAQPASTGLSMAGLQAPAGDATDIEALLQKPFFSLKAYMRKTYGVDPQNKDAALKWLRENGKLAA